MGRKRRRRGRLARACVGGVSDARFPRELVWRRSGKADRHARAPAGPVPGLPSPGRRCVAFRGGISTPIVSLDAAVACGAGVHLRGRRGPDTEAGRGRPPSTSRGWGKGKRKTEGENRASELLPFVFAARGVGMPVKPTSTFGTLARYVRFRYVARRQSRPPFRSCLVRSLFLFSCRFRFSAADPV